MRNRQVSKIFWYRAEILDHEYLCIAVIGETKQVGKIIVLICF